MKSSTTKLHPLETKKRFALTREQAEKTSAVEGMILTARMKRILDLPASGEERQSLIKAQNRKT